MHFFISKRLPFGLRAGVLFNPIGTSGWRSARPSGSIAGLGEGVSGVYVITGAHNMCKIGISTDPELRLAALQTGAHVRLKIHYVLAVKSIDPRMIEAEAHRILDKYRCAGEWFDVTPEMAEDAVNLAAAGFGIKTAQTTSADPLGSVAPKQQHWAWQFAWLAFGVAVATALCVAYMPRPDY